jgi:hypothetical protein
MPARRGTAWLLVAVWALVLSAPILDAGVAHAVPGSVATAATSAQQDGGPVLHADDAECVLCALVASVARVAASYTVAAAMPGPRAAIAPPATGPPISSLALLFPGSRAPPLS